MIFPRDMSLNQQVRIVSRRVIDLFCMQERKSYSNKSFCYQGWARNSVSTAFCSSFLAGFFMTVTVAPFDRIRTSLMNQPTDKKLYDSMTDCLVKTVRSEGPLSLWRGFIPIWARFAPMATLQLLTIEFLYSSFGFKSI